MRFAQIVAIVRPERLPEVEERLKDLNVPGLSVSRAKGFGDYADFYKRDWMVGHVRVEVFIGADRAEVVAEAIVEAAHTGLDGDGLVAVTPVSQVWHIRTRQKCGDDAC